MAMQLTGNSAADLLLTRAASCEGQAMRADEEASSLLNQADQLKANAAEQREMAAEFRAAADKLTK